MPESINWIHISDLHLGLDRQGWLWPRVKHDFFRDIERLDQEVDSWDLVLFTGDLTQTGDPEEFDCLNKELDELWQILSKEGHAPLLCVVPGNHDVRRPPTGSAMERALTQLWWLDGDLRRSFWSSAANEYRDAVKSYFAPYYDWCSRISVPRIAMVDGNLPGDFSATFEKGGIKLGIIGLNSTFLQISSGDFKGKLDLHVSQVTSVCDGDPARWIAGNTATLLLTHHPPSWLAPEALDHFRQEIYPSGRFLAHYCGHQHEPEAYELVEAGAAPRRVRQGPSLFGLEGWEGSGLKKRTHGYTAGQFVFEAGGGFERIWPRTTVKGRDGGLNLCPDHTYKLSEGDCVVTTLDIHYDLIAPFASGLLKAPGPLGGSEPPDEQTPELNLFEGTLDAEAARLRLASCPRLSLSVAPQHQFVRQEEQSQLELVLRSGRRVWLVADWGMGKEGFLGASLDRFRRSGSVIDAFHLRCDEASDIEGLESLFPQQFGMPLQTFCNLATSQKNAFLILDEIHPGLCLPGDVSKLKHFVSAVLDYCPDLRVILSSRLAPDEPFFERVTLRPLDAPDVRTYLMHHPDASPELQEAEVVEKLHERSDGLTMHLDRILSALRVSALSTVLDGTFEFDYAAAGMLGSTPRALQHAVSSLSRSRDKRTRRSFRLLKVLAVLPYGETLDTLHHYLPTDPFFEENAIQLHDLALLDVILLYHTRADISIGSRLGVTDAPKVLKVPRQIRDYIQTILSSEEREAILLAGMDRFFGQGWRAGVAKLRSISAHYQAYIASGVGNEFAVISQLLRMSTDQSDHAKFTRVLEIGLQYARNLKKADRYRDLSLVAEALVKIVDHDTFPAACWELTGLCGYGLRMIGKAGEGLGFLRRAIELGGNSIPAKERVGLWINVAYAEKSLGNVEEAVSAAEEAQRYAKAGNASRLEAEYIIGECRLRGVERRDALVELGRRAKKGGFSVLAENIALDLAEVAPSNEKVALLDGVLANKKHRYNQQRAIVAKAKAIQSSNSPGVFRSADVTALVGAYTYLHSQRFGSLFDQCHHALWRVFELGGNTPHLLKLFRHSSFVWRIRGDEAKEAESLTRLAVRDVPRVESSLSDRADLATQYFWLRMKLLSGILHKANSTAS